MDENNRGIFVDFTLERVAGIPFYEKAGVSFFTAFSVLVLWSVFVVFFVYCGIGSAINSFVGFLKKNRFLEVLDKETKNRLVPGIKVFFTKHRFQERLINWLMLKGKLATLLFAFIPWPWPLINGAPIIAAKLLKIKYGLCMLLIAALFKSFIVCFAVYL